MTRYTAEHLWVRLEEGGQSALAGITRHAQDTLGDIVLVDITARGAQPENTVIGTVESVKTASDLHMPLNGDIVETNAALLDNPGLVNEDPEGAGWIVRISHVDPAHFAALMDAAAYQAHTGA